MECRDDSEQFWAHEERHGQIGGWRWRMGWRRAAIGLWRSTPEQGVHSGRDFSRSKMYLKTQHSLHSSVVPIVTHAVPMKHTHSRQARSRPVPLCRPRHNHCPLLAHPIPCLPHQPAPRLPLCPPPSSGLSLPSPCARHCPFLSRYLSAAPLSIISLIQS